MVVGFFDNLSRNLRRKRIEWLGSTKDREKNIGKDFSKFFVVLFIFLSCVLLWQRYWEDVSVFVHGIAKQGTISLGMELTQVSIEGVHNSPSGELKSFIASETEGASLAFLDIALLREKIESFAWVEEASIKRIFPNSLFIRLKEHVPQARWQFEGKHHIVAEDGFVITENGDDRFSELTLLVGENANLHIASLREILSHGSILQQRVQAASWIGDRRWDIYFLNGVVVKLPQMGANEAWSQLQELAVEQLLLEHENLDFIDMRVSDRLVLHFKDSSEADFPKEDGA